MTAYIARRLVQMVPVVLLVSVVSFSLIYVLPGDPALAIIGEQNARDAQLYAQLRSDLGLDRPLPIQYLDWAAHLLRDPQVRAEDVAATVGLSMRQFRRRCHASVGYGPKTLQRVVRLRRFLATAPADLAAAAAEAGYADQPHLTRECQALTGLSPRALLTRMG